MNTLASWDARRERLSATLKSTHVEWQREPLRTATYWCAADGEVFGLSPAAGNTTCIAAIEEALGLAGSQAVRVTRRPAWHVSRAAYATPDRVERNWTRMWSRRTRLVNGLDRSLRLFPRNYRGET